MKKYKLDKKDIVILNIAKENQERSYSLLNRMKSNGAVVDNNYEYVFNPNIDFSDLLTPAEMKNAENYIKEIEIDFEKKTRLRKNDIKILMLAVALQACRQYMIDPHIKNHRNKAESDDESAKGNAGPGWYYVDTKDILVNRVPFDAIRYSSKASISGFLKGGNHRNMTLGHDPVLGWIFGTANIMTNTISRADLQTAHVKYKPGVGNIIYCMADTGRMFSECGNRVMHTGVDGVVALGSSLIREYMHLKSDIYTKDSLPIPFIREISSELAARLADYGIDTASVSTEIGLSSLVNILISMIHGLTYNELCDDRKQHQVRTRKILLYSNLIASSSNVLAAVFTDNMKILDVGGLIVTISRLFSDIKFITRVKEEFIEKCLDERYEGLKSEVDQIYSRIVEKKCTDFILL